MQGFMSVFTQVIPIKFSLSYGFDRKVVCWNSWNYKDTKILTRRKRFYIYAIVNVWLSDKSPTLLTWFKKARIIHQKKKKKK